MWGSWKFEWIRGPSPWFGYYKDLLSPSGIKKWSIVLVVDTDVVIVMQCFLSILTCCLYNMFSLLTGSWNQTPTERNCMKLYILILSWMIRRLGGTPGRSFWNGESLQDIAVYELWANNNTYSARIFGLWWKSIKNPHKFNVDLQGLDQNREPQEAGATWDGKGFNLNLEAG